MLHAPGVHEYSALPFHYIFLLALCAPNPFFIGATRSGIPPNDPQSDHCSTFASRSICGVMSINFTWKRSVLKIECIWKDEERHRIDQRKLSHLFTSWQFILMFIIMHTIRNDGKDRHLDNGPILIDEHSNPILYESLFLSNLQNNTHD